MLKKWNATKKHAQNKFMQAICHNARAHKKDNGLHIDQNDIFHVLINLNQELHGLSKFNTI